MSTSHERQLQIKAILKTADEAVSANHFSKQFSVSRQTIVGDVALLRAQGEAIIATPQGYQYQAEPETTTTIVCKHTPEEMLAELEIMIEYGATVRDVSVDHPVYGQLKGQLMLSSISDVKLFAHRVKQEQAHLLSELTGGIHLHTISLRDPEQLPALLQALREAGFLYAGEN